MGRPAKATVRYALPNERADRYGTVKVRGVASYARKRVNFTLSVEAEEIALLFCAINTDGTLRDGFDYNLDDEERETAQRLSAFLCHFRNVVLQIVERAIELGVWQRMNATDLGALLKFVSYPAAENEQQMLFGRRGIFTTWAKKTL